MCHVYGVRQMTARPRTDHFGVHDGHAQHVFPSARGHPFHVSCIRCMSDDCPPRTDHFGVRDGHVHVCRRSISLVVMHRI